MPKKTTLIATLAVGLAAATFPTQASAHDDEPVIGSLVGAAIGAAVGGPPGAAVGAIIGAAIGADRYSHTHAEHVHVSRSYIEPRHDERVRYVQPVRYVEVSPARCEPERAYYVQKAVHRAPSDYNGQSTAYRAPSARIAKAPAKTAAVKQKVKKVCRYEKVRQHVALR